MTITAYQLIPITGQPETFTTDLPQEPDYYYLAKIVRPLLAGCHMERVGVLHSGKPTDMFVDECGKLKGLPVNKAATDIYRANALKQNPATRPETLPAIYGPAVLFSRPVWF